MNPCPCGYYGDPEKECKCSAYEVIKYQKKISGPLLDRIDLQVIVGRVAIDELREGRNEPSEKRSIASSESSLIKERINRARGMQYKRFLSYSAGEPARTNAEMGSCETEKMAKLDEGANAFLETLATSQLSPRGYYRLLKVARTIADLEGREEITAEHLAEAFGYRLKEAI
jgi:magnesium chelatase family protein